MKLFTLFLGLIILSGPLRAQKSMTPLTSNLNMSKSNINRLIYPGTLLTPVNAQAMVADLDKLNAPDEAGLKTWLAANFKRYGVEPDQIKQIAIYNSRQFADCTICKKHCKGRCVQDPGSDCVCMYKSEPNLRATEPAQAGRIVFIATVVTEENNLTEKIAKTIESQPRVPKTN